MNIAIDIDDTITNTFEYLQPYTAEYCSHPLEELKEKVISYDNTPPEWGLVMNEFAKKYFDKLIPDTPVKDGAQRRLNTRNENPERDVKACAIVPQISAPSSATSAKPKRIPNVDTTFSLAINPVIVATAISQLTHPRGMKIQEIRLPMNARIELFKSSTIMKEPSSTPKACKNHNTIAESKIIVPAFLIKE